MARHSFVRMSLPTIGWQPLVRDDSRYAILPVMRPTEIDRWVVFDAQSGKIISPEDGDEQFESYADARAWINRVKK